jgi:hypothetical protein
MLVRVDLKHVDQHALRLQHASLRLTRLPLADVPQQQEASERDEK